MSNDVIQPTKNRPESFWRAKGYEFYYCKGCGHRFFGRGMALAPHAAVGPCEWCHAHGKSNG